MPDGYLHYRVYLNNERFACSLSKLATVRDLRDGIKNNGCSNPDDLVLSDSIGGTELSDSDMLLHQNFETDEINYYIVYAYVPFKFQLYVDGDAIDIVTTSDKTFLDILDQHNFQNCKLELGQGSNAVRISTGRTVSDAGVPENAILYLIKPL